MEKRKLILTLLFITLTAVFFASCGKNSTTGKDNKETANQTEQPTGEQPEDSSKDESLFIYCGAGMTKPFTEITNSFQKEKGIETAVTYANAAQIIAQIKASQKGDLFIAGAAEELESIKDDYVVDTKNLVKHIPVVAVQSGNPKNITGLKDLAGKNIKTVLGDSDATPIGKIADKALTNMGILNQVNIVARTTTAPEIATAISLKQCDAGIVWKENADADGVEVVDTEDMESYIKTVPAASLKCSKYKEAKDEFLAYLDTDAVKKIWEKYGYEVIEE